MSRQVAYLPVLPREDCRRIAAGSTTTTLSNSRPLQANTVSTRTESGCCPVSASAMAAHSSSGAMIAVSPGQSGSIAATAADKLPAAIA